MTRSRHITRASKQRVRGGRQALPRDVMAQIADRRAPRRKRNPETSVQSAVRDLLRLHPAVQWVERINSGTARIKGQFIAFGFKGCSDLIGQMTKAAGGVFLAVEVKGPKKYPTKEQRAFLGMVEAAGGFACWGRSVDEVHVALERWLRLRQAHQMSLRPPSIEVVTASRHLTPLP